MADPMTMAVIGAGVGAATSKNPLQGALLGGAGGFAGGSLLGGMGAASTAAGAGGSMTAVPAFGAAPFQTAAIAPQVAQGAIFANPTAAIGNMATGGGMSSGMVPSALAESPGFFDAVGQRFRDVSAYANQNPVLTQMGMKTAGSLLTQPQTQFAPSAGIARGNPQQIQDTSGFQFGLPRISLV